MSASTARGGVPDYALTTAGPPSVRNEPPMSRRTGIALPFALILLLAACTTAASPTAQPTQSSSPDATASATESASADPTASATDSPTPAPTSSGTPGGFTVTPHPEADALFLDRDDCQNPEDGYQLEFPEDWYTNTEIGSVPACSWFSPDFYKVDDPRDRPDEIAIEIFVIQGDRGYTGEVLSREEVIVGATQTGFRLEVEGTSDGADRTSYEYVVQLGPTLEEGPNLVARTGTEMGGDYELSKAVLDRIMARIDFIGTIQ